VFDRRIDRVLVVVVAAGLILLGIAEVIGRLDEPGPLWFWLPTLWGGATLILVGGFVSTENRILSRALVVAGCALGLLPSMWTLVMPVLLITVIFRTLTAGPAAAEVHSEI
jgi:hypothetical protein